MGSFFEGFLWVLGGICAVVLAFFLIAGLIFLGLKTGTIQDVAKEGIKTAIGIS